MTSRCACILVKKRKIIEPCSRGRRRSGRRTRRSVVLIILRAGIANGSVGRLQVEAHISMGNYSEHGPGARKMLKHNQITWRGRKKYSRGNNAGEHTRERLSQGPRGEHKNTSASVYHQYLAISSVWV